MSDSQEALKRLQSLLGNIPYPDCSPDEDWISPTVFLLDLWEGFEERSSLNLQNDQLNERRGKNNLQPSFITHAFPSTVTYQAPGENKVFIQSNPAKLSITGSPPAPTKQPAGLSWEYYVVILLLISFLFGVFGGIVNYYVGRPSKKEMYIHPALIYQTEHKTSIP